MRKANKPKHVEPIAGGHYEGPTLKHVRSVVSKDIAIQVFQTTDRAEKMRDDQGMLKAAADKRARKAAKAKAMHRG